MATNSFSPDTVNIELLRPRRTLFLCIGKAVARCYAAVVDGQVNRPGEHLQLHGIAAAAAWSYAHPRPLARRIRGHVEFGKVCEVLEVAPSGRAFEGGGNFSARGTTVGGCRVDASRHVPQTEARGNGV